MLCLQVFASVSRQQQAFWLKQGCPFVGSGIAVLDLHWAVTLGRASPPFVSLGRFQMCSFHG